MLVRVADDERDAVERGNLLGSALGIASGHQDAGRRVGAMDAPDGGARILIGRRSDGAGIQNDDFGLGCGACPRQSALGQLAFNGRAVGLGGSTSEIFHVETAHQIIIWVVGVVPEPLSLGPSIEGTGIPLCSSGELKHWRLLRGLPSVDPWLGTTDEASRLRHPAPRLPALSAFRNPKERMSASAAASGGSDARRFLLLRKALATINGPALRRTEWQRGFLSAARADGSCLLLGRAIGRCLGRSLSLLAGLAPSG